MEPAVLGDLRLVLRIGVTPRVLVSGHREHGRADLRDERVRDTPLTVFHLGEHRVEGKRVIGFECERGCLVEPWAEAGNERVDVAVFEGFEVAGVENIFDLAGLLPVAPT